MVELGLGKNMVRSAKFWAQACGVVSLSRSTAALTPFGMAVLGDGQCDMFLEDVRTLWLLHWNLSTGIASPLLAWDYLVCRWQEPEFVSSAAAAKMLAEVSPKEGAMSAVTVQQHLDVFLRTYLPSRATKTIVVEDNLDCPLAELRFLTRAGERELSAAAGGRETIYRFRVEDKPEISGALFTYCLGDYWGRYFPDERTLSLSELAYGRGSPGRVFRLPETDLRRRLEAIEVQSRGRYSYFESAQLQQVRRTEGTHADTTELGQVYEVEGTDAGATRPSR